MAERDEAERDEITIMIRNLRERIQTLRQTLRPADDLEPVIANMETRLNALRTQAETTPAGADLTPIQTELAGLQSRLARLAQVLTPGQGPPTGPERVLASLGQSGPAFGLVGLALVSILLAVIVILMGPTAWTTIEGGRAVLLLALTFAFVTFGGTLLITPFFSQWNLFDERFRRAREIFLLFSGTFATIVGFYFAAAVSPASSPLLMAETFNADKGELQVVVASGKAPYTIEVDYGESGAIKKKAPQTLAALGSVQFTFAKESDWPRPITIRVKDSADAKAERVITLEKDELIKAGFKEPTLKQQAGPAPLAVTSIFDESVGFVEVTVTGGKPPYQVQAIYGTNSTQKPLTTIATDGGKTRISFDKATDWPMPLAIVVTDAEKKRQEEKVPVEENMLTKGGFTKR